MKTVKMIPEGATLNGEYFDKTLLPEWLQVTAREHAESYGTPEELWVMAFLSGIAGAAGKKARLRTGNYTNYPQLWVMFVGASGTGKSDPFRVAFKPLQRINDRRHAEYQEKFQEWEANEKQGKPPVWEQLIVGDTTPEGLFPAIAHSNALTLYRDELNGWFSDFGRYNKSGEVAHYLSIYNNSQVVINRKTDRPQLINEPFLNICGTIQPGVLADVLTRNNMEDSGFAQRFLYLYPEFGPKKYARTVPPSIDTYDTLIGGIVNHQGVDEYSLSPEAEKEYEQYFNACEEKKYDGSGEFWSAVYSKAQIQVLRLALTVKIARLIDDSSTEVSGDDMRASISIMNYCINSLRKFRDERGEERRGEVTKTSVIRDIFKVNPAASYRSIAKSVGCALSLVSKVNGCTVNTLMKTASTAESGENGAFTPYNESIYEEENEVNTEKSLKPNAGEGNDGVFTVHPFTVSFSEKK